MKNRKLLVILVLLFSSVVFSQNPTNGGFEATIAAGTDWTLGAGGSVNTTFRTGVKALDYTTNSTAPGQANDNVSTVTVANGSYAHLIGWAKAAAATTIKIQFSLYNGATYSNSASLPVLTTTYTQYTYSLINSSGSSANFKPRILFRANTNGTPGTASSDDFIMYTSSSSTPDLTQPTIATSFTTVSATTNSINFSWTNGADAATGIQNTIILRTTNLAAGLPVMNNQGVYSTAGGATGPNIISTDWTVISTSVAAGTTSYIDTGLTSGASYKYAVIHRDMAYNYSPVLVSPTITCASTITSTTTGGLWSAGGSWVGGNAPTSNDDVVIVSGATITSDIATTRNTGTSTTVNSGGTLATGAFAYNNNGTTTINGTFQLDAGGSVTGNDFVYGGSPSTLVLNTTVSVTNTDQFWPSSGPYNVNVSSGGLTMTSANRTVAGVFQTAAAVTLTTTTLTLTGTCQINSGGSFTSGAPTYASTSTLIYNQGGSANVTNEWTGNSATPTAGSGTPQNVTITNTTALTMPAAARSMAGDLNISSGNLILDSSATPYLDLYIGGNWTRVSTATFTPNARTVYFSSSIANTTHLVTVSATGTQIFNAVTIQGSGTLKMAIGTSITITGSGGLGLNSTNATSTIDLNGQTLTVSGGGSLGWSSGAKKITSSSGTGSFVVSTSGLTVSPGGASPTLSTDTNTIVKISQSFNPGSSITTINGTLQINSGGSIATNSPIYGSSSLLQYNTTGTYPRGLEWNADTPTSTIGSTPGYPNNVQISNSTSLTFYNAAYTGSKGMNGNFTIDALSAITFGATATLETLTVKGNVTNAGTITLGGNFGNDLKVGGDYSNIGTGTFVGNSRAIWFIKNGTQTVSSATALTIPFVVTGGTGITTTVQLLSDVVISSSISGTSVISFGSSNNDIIDINGKNLTIGSAGGTGSISGTGTFKGSTTSNLTILGSGGASGIGTLSFTTGFQNLGTFTMNRQAGAIGCVLGSAVTVNTSLVLTLGLIDLGAYNLTLATAANISGGGSSSYVLAFGTSGGQLVKTFSAAGSFTYPIGDNTTSLDYSPATLTFAGGSYAGTVGVRVVDAAHPSNSGSDYITRYWQVLVSGVAPTSYTFAGTYTAGDIVGTESNSLPQCYNGTSWTDIGATGISSNTCTVTGTSFPYATNEFSAQTATLYYRSKQTADWNLASTWQTSLDNVTWTAAASPPTYTANTITIQSGHTVTITASVTIDQVYVTGNLTLSGTPTVTLNNGTGTDLTVNNGGILTNSVTSGGWSAGGTTVTISNGGTYIHNSPAAVSAFLDQTTFGSTSTMIYRGASGNTPAVSLGNRTFGHLKFESTSGSYTLTPNFSVTTCTSNDFNIGSGVTISSSSLASTSQFIVTGNFTNDGTMTNTSGYFNFTFSGTTKTISGSVVPKFDTMNVTGSYTLGTSVSINFSTGIATVAVGGILDNGGANQITGLGSLIVNGKFITRDAEGFTGNSAAVVSAITTTVNTGSTVEYAGASQTITAFSTYYNVTVSGTGTKTLLTTPIVMNGDLNVTASTLLVNTSEVIEVKKAVTVASGATFEIKDKGQLVQVDDTGVDTGNIIYNRTATSIKGYDYVYWASPVTGQSIDGLYSSPAMGLKYAWNPTVSNINTASTGTSGNWQMAAGSIMAPAKGYIVRGSTLYTMAATSIPAVFTGVPGNGIISATISRSGNTTVSQVGASGATVTNYDDNWNLVGNPYPSAIKAVDFLAANANIQGFVNLWTHGSAPISTTSPFYNTFAYNYTSNDYITYNAAGTNVGPSTGFNGYIGAGQGFFVAMNDGAAGSSTVTFNNSMRSRTHANSQFYRTTTEAQDVEEVNRIWLDLVDSNNESVRTLVGYFPEATVGLDRMYDAFKNVANDKNIYSIAEDKTLIIQGRPTPFDQNDQVPIGVRIMTEGNYKIAIGAIDGLFEHDQPIFLEDKGLNIIYDLRQNPYSFSSGAGLFNDRFVLRYNDSTLGNPEFEALANSVVLASNHGELTIKSFIENIQEVTVYDVLGRQLFFAKEISNKDFVTSNISASQQTLIVKIKLENGVMVSRKIIL